MPPIRNRADGDDRSWPDSEVAECADDFRFLGYSGLVVLTASLSESDTVEKGIFRNLEATLIQDRKPTRNLDSKIHMAGFVRFEF
jgi:hypothetical protein